MPHHDIPDPKDILAPGTKRKSVPSARAKELHAEGSVRKRPRPSNTSVGTAATAPNATTTPSIEGRGGRAAQAIVMSEEEEDDDDDDLQQQGVSEAITDRRSVTGRQRLRLTNKRPSSPSLDHRVPPQPPPVSVASNNQAYTTQVPQQPSQTALGKRCRENTPSENPTDKSLDADEEQLSM
jgi:hypothetical protein